MSGIGLNIGLSGMLSSQKALEVLGHNMSNANTPGYSRQRLSLGASQMLLQAGGGVLGNGVLASGVERASDGILGRRIVSQTAVAKALQASLGSLRGVESLFNPTGHDLGDQIDEFFLSAASLSTDPVDQVRRNGMVQSAQHLTAQFHQTADSVASLARDSENRVDFLLGEVNALAQEMVGLNQEIAQVEAGGSSANDLRDRRELVLGQLAELVDVQTVEHSNGSLSVTVGGHLLAGHDLAATMRSERNDDGTLELFVGNTTKPVGVTGGEIGGLMTFVQDYLPGLQARVDDLAKNLVLEINRAHSTGAPLGGGFERLTGWVSLEDADGDGAVLDEKLSDAGLPFEVTAGSLFVHVTDPETGAVESHELLVDPDAMSVGDLLESLDGIDGISAGLDFFNRVQILADGDKRFDFTARLDANPDGVGSFGGQRATAGSAAAGPFTLTSGATLDLSGTSGPFQITFDAADFADINEATAAEIAAVINADPASSAGGIRAVAEDGRLYLQSTGQGASESFEVLGGSLATAVGLPTGIHTGQDLAVAVELHGEYSGSKNQELTFTPLGDGTIGTTPGLQVEVRNAQGQVVGLLDVGEGYQPGSALELGDGLSISFGVGTVAASSNQGFVAHAIADSDTADLLVGLGLNSFFQGTDAEAIEVVGALVDDPSLLAASGNGAEGDNGALLELLALQGEAVEGLGVSFGESYSNLVGDIGFEVVATESAAATEESLVDSLKARRSELAGVNVDEELVEMIRFEQAFAASARFIQVVQELQDTVLRLI
ncbi:MAG: flagellar hook-associated protein FlgK [Planctomycetes bacterium]|nr:flagellar hook-associated protein FlgK [Planctomycetota bacterium]MDA0946893.1 flagellar hook-associated protein FlgK [Planctomycetota bacterium]